MSRLPRVAIILVNYNGKGLLERYLPSILELSYENTRIVVVDNDSEDNSVEFLETEFPTVTTIALDQNVGYSQGNNIGTEKAPDADYYWFVNTDVEVEPTALTTLVEHLESSPRTGMVVPRINQMSNRELIQSLGFDCNIATVPRSRENGRTTPSNPEPHPISYGSGAALLVDRDVWDQIGGFDPENFFYGDDIYLGMRCWMLGYRVEVVPQSVVYHEGHATQGQSATPLSSYHYTRSHTRVFLKLIERRNLPKGAPKLLAHICFHALADALYHRSPKAGLYRLLGLAKPFFELPEILRDRHDIQRSREHSDEMFWKHRTLP